MAVVLPFLVVAVAGLMLPQLHGRFLVRDGLWARLKYNECERTMKRRLALMSYRALVMFSVVLLAVPIWSYETFDLAPSATRTALAGINFLLMLVGFCWDGLYTPPSEETNDTYHVSKSPLGPFAYFTKQVLVIQTAHCLCSFYAELATLIHGGAGPQFRDRLFGLYIPKLAQLNHTNAAYMANLGVALFLLWYKLNWCEANWRRECLKRTLERGAPHYVLTVWLTHFVSAIAALVDLFFVKRPELRRGFKDDFISTAILMTCHCATYVAQTYFLIHKYDARPYPFMKFFTKPIHWLLFFCLLELVLGGVLLPILLGLSQLVNAPRG